MGTHPIFESDFDCLTDVNLTQKMQNDEGEIVDLYVPRKCSTSNRLIGSKDNASIQLNSAKLIRLQDQCSRQTRPSLFVVQFDEWVNPTTRSSAWRVNAVWRRKSENFLNV